MVWMISSPQEQDAGMRGMIDSILRDIKEDRTTGAVELVKKGVDALALFITN